MLWNTGDGRQYSTQYRIITAPSIWQPPYIPLPPLNLATWQKRFIIACTVAWVSTPDTLEAEKKKKRGLYETRNLGLNWATMKEPVYFLCLTGYVLFILETRSWSQVWWHVSLISALERQISVNSRSGWSTNWEACYCLTNSRTAKAIIKRNLGKQNSTDKIK